MLLEGSLQKEMPRRPILKSQKIRPKRQVKGTHFMVF